MCVYIYTYIHIYIYIAGERAGWGCAHEKAGPWHNERRARATSPEQMKHRVNPAATSMLKVLCSY